MLQGDHKALDVWILLTLYALPLHTKAVEATIKKKAARSANAASTCAPRPLPRININASGALGCDQFRRSIVGHKDVAARCGGAPVCVGVNHVHVVSSRPPSRWPPH
jgi:hypothetical protein